MSKEIKFAGTVTEVTDVGSDGPWEIKISAGGQSVAQTTGRGYFHRMANVGDEVEIYGELVRRDGDRVFLHRAKYVDNRGERNASA